MQLLRRDIQESKVICRNTRIRVEISQLRQRQRKQRCKLRLHVIGFAAPQLTAKARAANREVRAMTSAIVTSNACLSVPIFSQPNRGDRRCLYQQHHQYQTLESDAWVPADDELDIGHRIYAIGQ